MYEALPTSASSSPRLQNTKWSHRLTSTDFFHSKAASSGRRNFLHIFLVAVVAVDLFIFVLYIGYFRGRSGENFGELSIATVNSTAFNVTVPEHLLPDEELDNWRVPEPEEEKWWTKLEEVEEEEEEEVVHQEDVTKNSTLGFGEIMYISMPYRTDRQDAMELIAAYSNLKFNMFPGVAGDTINDKAKPPKSGSLNDAELGCWRAHVNAWRHILDMNYTTALILEDDIDFSAHLKDIMSTLSAEMASPNNTIRYSDLPENQSKKKEEKKKEETKQDEIKDEKAKLKVVSGSKDKEEEDFLPFADAPYGLDWDILTLGHCFNTISPDYSWRFHVYPDKYAPQDDNFPQHKALNAGTRMIRPSYGPVCTFGYAVTREGVEKLLYHVAYNELNDPVDLMIMNLLMAGKLHGYTVFPSLFSPWRVGGQKDSDIRVMPGDEEESTSQGSSGWELTDSVRQEMAHKYQDVDWWGRVKVDEDTKHTSKINKAETEKQKSKAEEAARKKEEKEEWNRKQEEEKKKKLEEEKKKKEEEKKKLEEEKKKQEEEKKEKGGEGQEVATEELKEDGKEAQPELKDSKDDGKEDAEDKNNNSSVNDNKGSSTHDSTESKEDKTESKTKEEEKSEERLKEQSQR